MRGTIAKRLRKAVYGELSLKQERRYGYNRRGDMVNIGERAVYQQAKKIYKERKSNGN